MARSSYKKWKHSIETDRGYRQRKELADEPTPQRRKRTLVRRFPTYEDAAWAARSVEMTKDSTIEIRRIRDGFGVYLREPIHSQQGR